MKENINQIITKFDNTTQIHWFEQKRFNETTSKENKVRFICQDAFALHDMIRMKTIDGFNPRDDDYVKNDSCIVIQNILPTQSDFDIVKKAIDCFVEFHKEKIIIAQVYPEIDVSDLDEEYEDINIEQIKEIYSISNHENIINFITGDTIPIEISEKNVRGVQLEHKDGTKHFYSIYHLMCKTFGPDMMTKNNKTLLENDLERMCKFYEDLGFVSIQEYSCFNCSVAYVYGNEIGKQLSNHAKEIKECF